MKNSVLDYAFAVGKIRALERFLIKEESFRQAIDLELDEALRLFVESDLYSDELLHIKNSQDLERFLDEELKKLKHLTQGLILDKRLVSLMELGNLTCVEQVLSGYPSELLKDYLCHLIDMYNIKTFLRLYVLQEPAEKLSEILSCNGFIPKEDFIKLYPRELSFFINRLTHVHKRSQIIDYAFFLKAGIEKAGAEKSFVVLEKLICDFLMQALKPAKFITFGPEPVLAYYFAKVNEINLMRMIILAKLNNLSSNMIKERMNAVYA